MAILFVSGNAPWNFSTPCLHSEFPALNLDLAAALFLGFPALSQDERTG